MRDYELRRRKFGPAPWTWLGSETQDLTHGSLHFLLDIRARERNPSTIVTARHEGVYTTPENDLHVFKVDAARPAHLQIL